MDDYYNQGNADYSDMQDRALGAHCVRYMMCKQTVYVLSITLTSYFCLNTAQYIHIVEYSECYMTDARVCWRSL